MNVGDENVVQRIFVNRNVTSEIKGVKKKPVTLQFCLPQPVELRYRHENCIKAAAICC